MKRFILYLIVLITTPVCAAWAQTLSRTDQKFHQASAMYINKDYENALATVKDGLKSDPRSEKLESLRKLLEQEQKKQEQQQQQDKKDQQKQDQQKKEQEQKDQQQKQDEKGEKSDQESEEKPEEQKDQAKEGEEKEQDQDNDNKDQDPQNQKTDPSKKLEEMKMSEEKARMILEAMKNQEMQYLQQQRRKATQPRDRNKPDW